MDQSIIHVKDADHLPLEQLLLRKKEIAITLLLAVLRSREMQSLFLSQKHRKYGEHAQNVGDHRHVGKRNIGNVCCNRFIMGS